MSSLLETKIAEWYGAGDFNRGKAALRDKIADGAFISTLAREIAGRAHAEGIVGMAVSRPVLSRLLRSTAEEKQLVREAREDGSHSLAERALELADAVEPNRDAVAKAKLQTDLLVWMSGKMNAKEFSPKSETSLEVHVAGQLFLQAVAKPHAVPPPRPTPAEIAPTTARLSAPKASHEAEHEHIARVNALVDEAMKNGVPRDAAIRFAVSWLHQHPEPRPALIAPAREEPDD